VNLLAAFTRPWRRAREHREAVALAADLELDRLFADMLADLERPEVDALVDARLADGTIPAALEAWARGASLETLRAYLAEVERLRVPTATAEPPPEPTLEELLAPAARALGVSPACYVAANLGRFEQWRATA
jgi:hypothetical protein